MHISSHRFVTHESVFIAHEVCTPMYESVDGAAGATAYVGLYRVACTGGNAKV